MEHTTILIIEDEPTINRIVSNYFLKEKFTVLSALDGFKGLQLFSQNRVDLVCLDIMMPNVNGWDVAKTIRETSNVPIIMMSALSEEEDILKGYSLKVDDYITKPFNPKILVAKVRNLLERLQNQDFSVQTSGMLELGGIKMDLDTHKVYLEGDEKELSKTEFDLLKYFLEHESKICSRNLLLDEVWGIDVYVEDRIVDTYVKKLRKFLGHRSNYIKTVFGVGYRFEVPHETD
ncbi:response regulator transcription factor [Candidatus Xianfuyuplasma coldseepsis]|uniref:Response regulator transcription factor n=1 Tax=Candidatus Xianfuyuplasma coldseepsis TaxID=2782163 RepID=A0A7L7KQF5_9MOLU|nr:response regulator transcription factor [Xianfuyuplasma coldseepsis]QMS85030.1 response regulator transcription factor [Xianfuyuplasma coldseepsis]